MNYILIKTTFTKKSEVNAFANKILNEKLVADAQVSKINSLFTFEGKFYNRAEWLLTMKTREELYLKVEEFIKQNHSFKVPQIVATKLEYGSVDYFNWIAENTKGE